MTQQLFGQYGVNSQLASGTVSAPAIPDGNEQTKPSDKKAFNPLSFLKSDEPEIEINLGIRQAYEPDKSLFIIIILWMFLGGFGAHRYYLGHKKLGRLFSMSGAIVAYLSVTALITSSTGGSLGGGISTIVVWVGFFIWTIVDGIYVIIRKITSG